VTALSEGIEDRLDMLLDRVARLSDTDLMVLRSIWDEADAVERKEAWKSVKRVVNGRDRQELLERGQSRLSAWVNNYLSAAAVEYGNFLINPRSGMDAATVRRAALPPLLDAVAATVAADGLTGEERRVLLEPLASLDH
jgi:hypothetical protein